MEITEREKRRAMNQAWNGAADYGWKTDFLVYSEEGSADLYWNTVVGVLRRRFDWERIMEHYAGLRGRTNQQELETLFWIGAESAVFAAEKRERPVFADLRAGYAKDYAQRRREAKTFGERLCLAHFLGILGEDYPLDETERKVLSLLEGEAGDTEALLTAIDEALSGFAAGRVKRERRLVFGIPLLPVLPFIPEGLFARSSLPPVRRLAFGFGEHEREYVPQIPDAEKQTASFSGAVLMTREARAAYIAACFGKSMYPGERTEELEKKLCTGHHDQVRLHFTRGEEAEEPEGADAPSTPSLVYARRLREQRAAQYGANRAYFLENERRFRLIIEELTRRLRTELQILSDDEEQLKDAGELVPGRVYRALHLGERKVWKRVVPADEQVLSVDLVLDGSGSQSERAREVAAQGVMIAESLEALRIPVRVYSFCSQSGYTVMTLLKDFGERGSENIFRFFTTGANRDGLAIRAVSALGERVNGRRLMIVLTDALPLDGVRVRTMEGGYREYAEETAVGDTAEEVHRARLSGVEVLAVFNGRDEDAESARAIYGTGFVRISGYEWFARSVCRLLLREIGRPA